MISRLGAQLNLRLHFQAPTSPKYAPDRTDVKDSSTEKTSCAIATITPVTLLLMSSQSRAACCDLVDVDLDRHRRKALVRD